MTQDGKQQIIHDNARLIMFIMIGVAVFCILFPFRTLINKRVNLKEALNETTSYSSLALSFSSDYDKENPLTTKAGQIRLLEMEIKTAEANGD